MYNKFSVRNEKKSIEDEKKWVYNKHKNKLKAEINMQYSNSIRVIKIMGYNFVIIR